MGKLETKEDVYLGNENDLLLMSGQHIYSKLFYFHIKLTINNCEVPLFDKTISH